MPLPNGCPPQVASGALAEAAVRITIAEQEHDAVLRLDVRRPLPKCSSPDLHSCDAIAHAEAELIRVRRLQSRC